MKGKKKWLIPVLAALAVIEALATVGLLPPVVVPVAQAVGGALAPPVVQPET